jgi:hypothetical protein
MLTLNAPHEHMKRVALGYIQNKENDMLTTALACQFEAVGMKRHAM